VRAAARRLTVHPNTLRYRVRRATAIAGLHLDDPRARLVHHLQLLAVAREHD
jgi:DNA-binding PucR family transcriptional regulator